MVRTAQLLDGKQIPWLAFGTGSAGNFDDEAKATDMGAKAIQAGFKHLDTAQMYNTEDAARLSVEKAGVKTGDVWITSKRESTPPPFPLPLPLPSPFPFPSPWPSPSFTLFPFPLPPYLSSPCLPLVLLPSPSLFSNSLPAFSCTSFPRSFHFVAALTVLSVDSPYVPLILLRPRTDY